MKLKEVTVGDISRRSGIAVSAIHFYESRGMLHPNRTAAGHRRYLRSDIRRVSFIKIAQELGFSLNEISLHLEKLPRNKAPSKSDWSKIGKEFRESIDDRIKRLEQLRDKLDGCIGCGCLSLENCALYNPDDEAGNAGAGPRYLMDR